MISRGEAELAGLGAIEAALSSRLFVSIHRDELDLQNKLLHVLHSVIFAISNFSRNHQPAVSNGQDLAQLTKDAQPLDLTHDEFFVRLLSDAVSQDNNAIIHHWIDFLLMTIPQFRQQLHTIVLPLIDSLVLRLRTLVKDFETSYSSLSQFATSSSITDAEYTALANALERLILIAVSEAVPAGGDDEVKSVDRPTSETGASGGGGLLGYMTGVLGHPEAESTEVPEEIKVRSLPFASPFGLLTHSSHTSQRKHEALQRVRDVVELLLLTWDVTSTLETDVDDDRSSSQGHFAVRAKVRARRALERIYKASAADVLDNLVVYWHRVAVPAVRPFPSVSPFRKAS